MLEVSDGSSKDLHLRVQTRGGDAREQAGHEGGVIGSGSADWQLCLA
jgi:hypothetical protein